MCLLIHQPRGVTFSKKDLKDFLSFNQDGFGMAYPQDGRLNIVKVVDDDRQAIDAYFTCMAGRPGLLHFRMATHGDKTAQNCHPFRLTDEIAMAHNGILSIDADAEKGWSDTRLFAEHVLKPMAMADPDALFHADVLELLGGMIGPSNRLMFIRADGATSIVNKSAGVVYKRAWLSNTYAWSSPDNEEAWWRKSAYANGYEWEGKGKEVQTGRNVLPVKLTVITGGGNANEEVVSPTPREADDAPDLSDDFLRAVEDVSVAWFGLGFQGVREWITRNSETAIMLITEWYAVTADQALATVTSNPQLATQWLCEIVSDDPAFT